MSHCARNVRIVGYAADQHGVTGNSVVAAGGDDHPLRVGQVVGEARIREVGVDEGCDVVECDRRGTGQRERARGDGGEFDRVDGIRGGDTSYRFHCAR